MANAQELILVTMPRANVLSKYPSFKNNERMTQAPLGGANELGPGASSGAGVPSDAAAKATSIEEQEMRALLLRTQRMRKAVANRLRSIMQESSR